MAVMVPPRQIESVFTVSLSAISRTTSMAVSGPRRR